MSYKIGDRVQVVRTEILDEGAITEIDGDWVRVGPNWYSDVDGHNTTRRIVPLIEPPLTRPDEPPYGVPFRINDKQKVWVRLPDYPHYTSLDSAGGWIKWEIITEPGDTITRLELIEVRD